ncbi:unnamed protein product [Brassica oleracea]
MELERFENYPWGDSPLQVWVYTALPELGANYGNPLPNNPSPPILAYKGRKGHIQFKEVILSHTRVINFVQKDIGEMFPKWEFDVEDTPAENIIKLMFVKKPWKWTMDCWEITGTWVNTKPAIVSPANKNVVKEDSPRPQKKARKEASEEANEEAAAEASEEVHTVARSEVTTTIGGLTKEDFKTMFKDIVNAMREGLGRALRRSSICRKGWKLWRRRLVSPQNGKGHQLKTLPLHLNRRSNPGVKVLMGRTREGRACRRIKVQIRRMLDIWKRGMLLWHFAVQRVIEQGNLLPHGNLLIRQTTRPK